MMQSKDGDFEMSIDVEEVFKALADTKYKWRTPRGVAEQLNIPEEEVLRVIMNDMEKIVQSSVPSTDGSPLFTTREHFLKTSSTFDKIIGAFKGRIR